MPFACAFRLVASEGRSKIHVLQCPSLALQACRKRRAFENTCPSMPFACASGLSQAKGVRKYMSFNALHLRFRLVSASDHPDKRIRSDVRTFAVGGLQNMPSASLRNWRGLACKHLAKSKPHIGVSEARDRDVVTQPSRSTTRTPSYFLRSFKACAEIFMMNASTTWYSPSHSQDCKPLWRGLDPQS